MLAYMISHDAHHRGQVCMLAHQLGFPLPTKAAYGIWVWENYGRSADSRSHDKNWERATLLGP
jgi:uncharacterized damage-inducible protein DinB